MLQLSTRADFAQCLTQRCHIEPVPLYATLAYIQHHPKVAGLKDGVTLVSDDDLRLIADLGPEPAPAKAGGIPRRINQVCAASLAPWPRPRSSTTRPCAKPSMTSSAIEPGSAYATGTTLLRVVPVVRFPLHPAVIYSGRGPSNVADANSRVAIQALRVGRVRHGAGAAASLSRRASVTGIRRR